MVRQIDRACAEGPVLASDRHLLFACGIPVYRKSSVAIKKLSANSPAA